jgi:hypothetical protein
VATAATAPATVWATAYTEQAANAQRSIASSSAADASAGTGARTVRLTYYTLAGAGPYSEVLTLNGTTGVNTVATDICFIESIEVLTVGSGGVNAGTISLYTAINKGGVVFGSIAIGDGKTNWAHHYIGAGKVGYITGLSVGHNGTTIGSSALFILRARFPLVPNTYEVQVSDFVRLFGQSSTFSRVYATPIRVAGFARVTAYVIPESSSSFIYRAAIDYYDQ